MTSFTKHNRSTYPGAHAASKMGLAATTILLACGIMTLQASAQYPYHTVNIRRNYYLPQSSHSNYRSQQQPQYQPPSASPPKNTFDKYFAHRPTLSPYLNLVRGPALGGGSYVNNYYAFVRPEIERRAQASANIGRLRRLPNNFDVNPFYNRY